jgi:NAD-dependent DNA ligase
MRDNRELLERLFAELDISSPPAPLLKERGAISGKSFCVTGSFDGISRDEIHELIEQN